MSHIVVIGSYGVGFTFTMPRAPGPGETVLADGYSAEHGGKGSNQAIGARRLGATVHLVTAVGTDLLADEARTLWAAEDVQTRLIVVPDAPTMTAAVLVDGQGENRIAVSPGALGRLGPDSLDGVADLLAAADVVCTQLEVPLPFTLAALAAARRAGARTVLNPSPVPPPGRTRDFTGVVDDVVANVHEARLMVADLHGDPPDEPADLAVALHRGLRCTAVVTAGERGAWVATGAEATAVPAVPVRVVDTTGAGDSFAAAYAVSVAAGADPVSAARYGCLAGSFAVTRPGVIRSLPTRADLEGTHR